MSNSNDYACVRRYKTVLGALCTVNITGTYNVYDKKRIAGVLNVGKTIFDSRQKEVCLIGYDKAVNQEAVQIIAVARSREDKEDVLVCAPAGRIFYEPKICLLTSKYLPLDKYSFVCLYEKSCGAVLYTEDEGQRKYILITNISGHIGFPKGHIEQGENEKQTARREIYEETGVNAKLIEGFRQSYNYYINGFIKKRAVYFLAHFCQDDIKMNIREISEYRLVSYEQAMTILNFKHDRDILESADKFIDSLGD